MTERSKWITALYLGLFVSAASSGQVPSQSVTLDLPTSKQIREPVPGSPQRLNSLPMAVAWSPDHRYLAVVNAGYGTFESKYDQSIAVLDTVTGKVTDTPDDRTGSRAHQTMYAGLAFSLDGKHLYASFDSLTSPEGTGGEDMGNAIAEFAFADGSITTEKTIPVPLQVLAKGRMQNEIGKRIADGLAIPAPAGLAVLKGRDGSEQILVADNFSDDALLLDAASGKVIRRFDLAETSVVPAMYPVAVAVSRDNARAYVALWNGSAVAELNLTTGTVVGKLALLPPIEKTSPSSHPAALAISPDGRTLFVALANRDSVAAVSLGGARMHLAGLFDTRLPGQTYFGAMPDAVAVSEDGRRLYAANTGSNAVAVFELPGANRRKTVHPLGFIPTEWYPTALAIRANKLYIVTGKGQGTQANAAPQPMVAGATPHAARRHTYIATLLHGSLAEVDRTEAERDLKRLTAEAVTSNRMDAAAQHLAFHAGVNPIHHVIYIIKENRTYDQIFGDLGVGDGDPSLTMYGRSVTPNLHRLAEQFGVLDRFYDSGEVSGNGHVWSTAGITSDYTEKTWQQSYRGHERPYDYEGVVEEGYPLLEGIPDVDEPGSSYLWTNLAKHGRSLYHFGEFVASKFCDDSGEAPKDRSPWAGTPEPPSEHCQRGAIAKGEQIPENYGGGTSPYPWKIPLIYENVATKPELQGHFDPAFPDFNLSFPDQLRVEEFLTHFRAWQKDLAAGHDTMPEFVMLRLPNDHTAGTTPGMPRPEASVADNDLAVGRAVDAVSHSGFWGSTAFFVLEDDAQDGADHVDAHRSIALVISKYSPRLPQPVIDHNFYTTVSVIRTMEDLLRIPPMNNNDAFAPLMALLFTGDGDQSPFAADYRNRDNGLIYEANSSKSPGAKESSKMDFRHADRADARALNVVLWKEAMGDKPVPKMVMHPHDSNKTPDDDD